MPGAFGASPLVSLESTPRIGCMSPLVSFKFGLEGLPSYPVWAAHFLWSVSSPKGPPHLQSAMHPLWLVPGWVGRSSSTPERTCIYATNPKLPHIPCPQNTRPGTRRRGTMSSKGAAQAQGRQRAAEGSDSDYPPRK
jgi:hypothetical protein